MSSTFARATPSSRQTSNRRGIPKRYLSAFVAASAIAFGAGCVNAQTNSAATGETSSKEDRHESKNSRGCEQPFSNGKAARPRYSPVSQVPRLDAQPY